jgi:hypothetical protein
MATQTPQRANAIARATLARAEQLFHMALNASARLGGRALRALGRILSGRWPLVVAVIVAAVAIWLLATRAPAALLFVGQVVVIVAVLLAALVALLWALARPRLRWSPPNGAHDAHDSALNEASGSPVADEAARRIAALLRGMKGGDAASGEISRGLLLVGPDAAGKRALARRISAESGAALGYVSAASFHTSALGLDAWAMRSVIRAARRRARSHGASILYLDHLDLVSAGARAELSAQLDSPGAAAPALTIGATSARAALDPALLRPGRFDLQIELAAPTDAQRAAVIARALSQTSHDALPLARMVTDMRGYTPTEITRAVNEALALAHGAGRERATAQDFEAACAAHACAHEGSAPVPVNALSATEKRRLAYTVAGRVVALATLEPQEPVTHLTIRAPRERRAEAQEMAPRSADEIFAAMQIALASRAAQEVFLQARLTDAADDLAEATALALGCVARWGMGDSLIATPLAQSDERLLADPSVREQVERLLRRAYEATRALLERHRAEAPALAEALAEREDLDGAAVAELLRTANSPAPGHLSALTSVAEATLFGTPVAPDFQTPAAHVIGPVAPTAPATSAAQPAGVATPRVSRASGPSAFAASPSQELRADRVIDRALLRAPLHSRGARRTDPSLPAVSRGVNGATSGASNNSPSSAASGANGSSGG